MRFLSFHLRRERSLSPLRKGKEFETKHYLEHSL